jgi:hypothetical protein
MPETSTYIAVVTEPGLTFSVLTFTSGRTTMQGCELEIKTGNNLYTVYQLVLNISELQTTGTLQFFLNISINTNLPVNNSTVVLSNNKSLCWISYIIQMLKTKQQLQTQ